MPDTYYDFSWVHPSIDELAAHDAKGILVYITPNPSGIFNIPEQSYLEECVRRGITVSPIFETSGTRADAGYQAGRDDGDAAVGWMERVGIPDGVRLWLNVGDTPVSNDVQAIGNYCAGFCETFPGRWQVGAYGNHAALYAAQYSAPRIDKLWAVETWGPPAGSVDDHWQWWLGQPQVVLMQIANFHTIDGTDDNWLVPGRNLDAWGVERPTQHGVRYPFDGEVRINSPWGPRDGGFHYGIDFWAPNHTPILACAPGQIFYAGFEPGGGGNHMAQYLDYPPSPAAPKAGYMHLESFVAQVGQHVEAGELIAYSNNTGASTGPHLHFWMGQNANVGAVDPTPFLEAGLHTEEPPMPDLSWLESTLTAMKGDDAVGMVLYGPYEVSFHVNEAGQLVHNSVDSFYGITAVRDEVLLEGLDRTVQPAARVANNNVIVTVVDDGGGLRRIVWLGGQGRWVDSFNENAELTGIHPL